MTSSMTASVAATKMAVPAAATVSPAEVAVSAGGIPVPAVKMSVSAVMVPLPARENYAAADCGLITISVAGAAVVA
jgi:hypothetical protein